MFYTLVNNAHLRQHYRSVMRAEPLPELRDRARSPDAGDAELSEWFVGARRCVTEDALRIGISAMKSELDQAKSTTELGWLIAFHNLWFGFYKLIPQ